MTEKFPAGIPVRHKVNKRWGVVTSSNAEFVKVRLHGERRVVGWFPHHVEKLLPHLASGARKTSECPEPWLGTNSGKVIGLTVPNIDEITIEDIATGLSNVCRFNGQLKTWYSVAEHSIHVAELVPKEYKLQALLHDATEAYICDVPTPLKKMLGEAYASVERVLAGAIGRKFGVDLLDLPASVLQADRIMVVSERDAFQDIPQSWGPGYENVVRYPNLVRVYKNPTHAKEAFLRHFHRYAHQGI